MVGTVLEDYECQLVTMTVEEEVAFSLENRGVRREEIAIAVNETLRMVGLAGLEKREVTSLSGGQKQRLAIGAALASKPAVLVLDEPTSALDPDGAEELYALLGRLNRETGLTLMIVEHDLSRVLPHADRLVVLEAGRLVATGKTEEVLAQLVTSSSAGLSPSLWTLKHLLESRSGAVFSSWLSNQQAVDQIRDFLQPEGAVKIA
jgi:energy-coupling factor transport system ATP-binding protein